jgi:hypothetical protein
VEYIVKNTVGRLLEGKTPRQVASLRILDPACGSGSFLIGAYQYLLDWHRDWYVDDGPQKWRTGKSPALYQTPTLPSPYEGEGRGGGWRLTTTERKRILLNSIYGVDIDPQAVEVTKLSLLLKVLEGENEQTLATQLRLFHERALPDLGSNVKCGNSLIGPDFYESQQVSFLDEEERYRLNVFDWQREFPEVMQDGGFDVVIGNPPYSAKQSLETKKLMALFDHVEYKCDPYAFFIEQGLRKLKRGGALGFIAPVTWMTNFYYRKLRQWLIESQSLRKIVLIEGLVFKGANVDTCLLFLDKESVSVRQFEWSRAKTGRPDVPAILRDYEVVMAEERYDISPEADDQWLSIKHKADNVSIRLDAISKISLGMKLRSNKEFVSNKQDEHHPDPIFFGDDISRYGALEPSRFFNFELAVIVGGTKSPVIHKTKPKIFIQAIRNLSLKRRIVATIDVGGCCFVGTLNGLTMQTANYDIRYVLGLINSTFLNTYFRKRFTTISLTAAFLGILPIRTINFSDPADKARHDRMVALVEQMLALHKQLAAAKTPDAKTVLQRQVDATDKQIDRLVYELYGLTEEEIAVVEGKA